MKFLCLHGAVGNITNYRVQLKPFCDELEDDKSASFCFVEGTVPLQEPPGFEGYFGPGPHWRWLDDDNIAANAMMESIREFPDRETPEEALRALVSADSLRKMISTAALSDLVPDDVLKGKVPDGTARADVSEDTLRRLVPDEVVARLATGALDKSVLAGANLKPMLDRLYAAMDAEGDVDGVLGYSEGALVASTLMLEDERRVRDEGAPRRLKAGIFFAGWPPLNPQTGHVVLSDEEESAHLRIKMPTVHVIGSFDPYLDGSKALYNVCDEETAIIFDHAKGHTLPRDTRTVSDLGKTIRQAIRLGEVAA